MERPVHTSDIRIRPSRPEELDTVLGLLDSGREIMHSSGNPLQWPKGTPSPEKVMRDIEGGHSYLILQDGAPVATFAFIPGPDPTYARIDGGAWLSDRPYYVIHRIAKLPAAAGVFKTMMDWCFSQSANIRIDTHHDNAIMRHCLEKYGFSYCGIIYLENGDERLAYQKEL